MPDKYLSKAQELAKSSIYDDAEYLGEWNGYAVFEPMFDDNEPRYIGFPQFILAQNGSIRWSADDRESTTIMNALWK